MSPIIKSIRRVNGATVVDATGEINMHFSPDLHRALVELVAERPARLVINLAEVAYIDSSGVGTLVEIFRRVKGYQGKLALVSPPPRVKSMLEITKLDQFFTILTSEQDALVV
ncbi:MAG TPA: STAS domain-containing protein [Phycisphaerae bacterium]|jgi:anti-sigma B factor antagonist